MKLSLQHTKTRRIALIAVLSITGIAFYSLGYRQGAQSSLPLASVSKPAPALTAAPPEPEPLEKKTTTENVQSKAPPSTRGNPARFDAKAIDWRNLGYEEARTNLDAALERSRNLNSREQAFFVAGLFKYIAENSSPRDALTIASAQEGASRGYALKSLVAEWAIDESLPEDQRENRERRLFAMSGGRLGLETELASVLARSSADPSVSAAWIDAFSQHPSRSEIVARLSPGQIGFDPAATLELANGWTDWERNRFTSSLIRNWANQDPKEAWQWLSANRPSLPADASNQILDSWARTNPDEIIQSLDTFTDPESRLKAIEAVSAALAAQGTGKALDWVENLPQGEERDAALQAVYENTPKGIGAVLKAENGFPKIAKIMPSGALASTSLQAGDLIVESRDSGKDPQNLYGRDLRDIVGLLRGAPGSEVEIRVLRENKSTGQLEEHSATVVRDLLILDSGRN